MAVAFSSSDAGTLSAIVDGPCAWVESARMEALGHDPAALAASGWLARWEFPRGSGVTWAWTLSPLGASLLGVVLREVPRRGADPLLRWVAEGKVLARPRERKPKGEVELRYPELIIDKAPGPEYLVDFVSGAPVELFCGHKVLIDKRLGRRRPKARRGA